MAGIGYDNTMITCGRIDQIFRYWTVMFTVDNTLDENGDPPVWKIRVNDTAGNFTDNGGNLAYKLYERCATLSCSDVIGDESIPVDMQGYNDICAVVVARPAPFTVEQILDLGNYIGSWLYYVSGSVMQFVAWCPRHSSAMSSLPNMFLQRDPFATLSETIDLLKDIQAEINAYDWSDSSAPEDALGGGDSSPLNTFLNGPTSSSPWSGAPIVLERYSTAETAWLQSCNQTVTEILGSMASGGFCVVSNLFRETGLSFWFQILLDLGVAFAFVKYSINLFHRVDDMLG